MEKAILPQSDVGKTKEEIRRNCQQLACDDRNEDATTGPEQAVLKAFCYHNPVSKNN